jgi:hypothetical protein
VSDFLANTLPEPHTILGLRLKPLAIGHLIWLARFGVERVDDAGQLITALMVCSRRFEEVQPTLADPLFDLRTSFWLWRVSPKSWRFWQRGPINWRDKFNRWDAYYAAHTVAPKVAARREGSNLSSNLPFLQHLKVTLQSKLNYTPSEALNCPFNVAILDYYTHHEMEGVVEVLDPEKMARMQKVADENSAAWIAAARKLREEAP